MSKPSITDWLPVRFTSSTTTTSQFTAFYRAYRKAIVDILGPGYELVNFKKGHFYAFGFARRRSTGRLVYISCSDVRFFPKRWYDNILIRTAEHDRDFTGGRNHTAALPDLCRIADQLTA